MDFNHKLPTFQFPNEPAPISEEEKAEYKALLEEFENKRFKTESERDAFMEFAPEYARFQELFHKLKAVVEFRNFVSYLKFNN